MDDTLNRISEYMKEHKIKKIDLLKELGLDKSTWSAWARDDNNSYIKYLPQIATYFDVSIDWLAGTEQKNKPLTEREKLSEEIMRICMNLPEEKQRVLLDTARCMVEKDK